MSTVNGVIAVSVAFAVVVVGVLPVAATTYVVSPDGLGDYTTIQAAVDATVGGDVIDCEGTSRSFHRGFHFASTGTGTASLIGVAVTGGLTATDGGGIWIEGADTVLDNCAVVGCIAYGSGIRGSGLYVEGLASPTVRDCVFTGNTGDYGGGVGVGSGGGLFEGCTIIDNSALNTGGGLYLASSIAVEFLECEIVSNTAWRAGGVRFSGNGPVMTDCLIARNEATSSHSGGLWLQAGTVTGCTIVDNASGQYGGDLTDQTGLGGNISEDPQLCGMDLEDYALYNTSPCLPGGNGCFAQIGAFGQGCLSPVERSSWGTIKAMYR